MDLYKFEPISEDIVAKRGVKFDSDSQADDIVIETCVMVGVTVLMIFIQTAINKCKGTSHIKMHQLNLSKAVDPSENDITGQLDFYRSQSIYNPSPAVSSRPLNSRQRDRSLNASPRAFPDREASISEFDIYKGMVERNRNKRNHTIIEEERKEEQSQEKDLELEGGDYSE